MAIDLEQVSKSFSKENHAARPYNTQKLIYNTLKEFDNFCKESYQEGSDSIYPKLANYEIKATQAILQKWINWNLKRNQKPSTIKLKLHFISSKLNEEGVNFTKEHKKKLSIPKNEKPKLHALSRDELQKIIGVAKPLKKAMYLCQTSSGMRIGEILQLRKSDLDFSKERIQVNIRASITKLKQARLTFLSKEAEKYLKPFLENLEDNDLIFTDNKNINNAVINESIALKRYCEKVGLDQTYPGTHDSIITTHSMRSFAISKLNKVDEFGFGHALSGHGYYMKQYDRFTDEELLKLYIKAEPQLWIYNSIPESDIVKSLRDRIEALEEENYKKDVEFIDAVKPTYYSKIDIENQRKGLY